MSWRVLFAILIIAAGASAWGGFRLGDWLVAHTPESPVIPEYPELDGEQILGADGRPFFAQAPQPLVNGRQAVPEPPEPLDWKIEPDVVDRILSNPLISVATTRITLDEAIQIAGRQSGGSAQLDGLADLSGLGLFGGRTNANGQPLQPIDGGPIPPPPDIGISPEVQQAAGDWQAALARDLEACKSEGFFARPSCAWNARNKYCGPNNAWGRAPNCPAKN
ncbi:hypothetical protein [Paracandidimonas soli]|uniref:hypothetical protein n=1 Tax=Paracandidimonas soli TaxID=1917182 RepID=UPI0033417067